MEERLIKFKRLMRYKADGILSWHYQTIVPLDYEGDKLLSALFFEPKVREDATFEWVSPPLEYSGLNIAGVEIYEGDKGSNNASEWEVIFNKGCFCGKLIGEKEERETHIALRAIQGFKYTGNIYENKFKK